MILNEKELKVILEFALQPILTQYSISINESEVWIDNKINIKASVVYQEHVVDLTVNFLLDYENHAICFKNINGKIEYLFLKLNIMNMLKQFINLDDFEVKQDSCYYHYPLPIESIQIIDHCLNVELKEK